MRKLYTLLLVSAITTWSYASSDAETLTGDECATEVSSSFGDADSTTARIGNEDATVSIFPNPVKSYATISFTYDNVDKISILNIVGREIKTVTPEPGKPDIKVSLIDLQPGVYFLAVYYQGNTLITKKFLKEE